MLYENLLNELNEFFTIKQFMLQFMFQFEYHYTFVFKTEERNWDNYTDYWYIMADFDIWVFIIRRNKAKKIHFRFCSFLFVISHTVSYLKRNFH